MRHLSFHQKVFLAILLTSVLVLTIVIVPLFWNSSAQYKQQLEIQTAAQSRMLASMNTASVMFEQPEAATSMLSALKEQPDITSAHLYKLDGSTHQLSLFAAYGEPIEIDLTKMPEPGASFTDQQLRYTEPLLLDDSVIGYLLLDVSMQGLAAKMAQLRWTLAGALFFAIIIASWLALVASRSALKPLQDLKDVTSSIATTKDYSRRAELLYDADLSDVIRSFNAMLDVIEQKNQLQQVKEQEVLELNKTLEQKVIERTSELQKSVTELDKAIAHLKATQGKLVEQEKMASLGNLVAGVAHEINTPIGVAVTAVTHLTYLTDQLSHALEEGHLSKSAFIRNTHDLVEAAAVIQKNLERAAEQIRSFKLIAIDQSSEEARSFNLLEYIQNVILSLKPKLKKTRHSIKLDMANDIEIYSFPGIFSQIFTNLIMNSLIHGFANKDDGEICIQATIEDGFLHLNYYDNGCGIAAEVKPKIWDPFVTTNRAGGGSGLGTYILYNLITQGLSGRIDLIDDVPAGVHFAMLIPLVTEPVYQLPHQQR
jgi:signal transduction histidine kinase